MPYLPNRFERQLTTIRISKTCRRELSKLKIGDEPIGETVHRCVKFYQKNRVAPQRLEDYNSKDDNILDSFPGLPFEEIQAMLPNEWGNKLIMELKKLYARFLSIRPLKHKLLSEEIIGHAGTDLIDPNPSSSAANPIATFVPGTKLFNDKFSDPCCCKTCPAAKRGDHDIPHNKPNTVTKLGYFCIDCMGELGIGLEKNNFTPGKI
jgi:hypothetical protein